MEIDEALKSQLGRSMFRFRKVGMAFNPGLDVNMGEIAILNGIANNDSGCDTNKCVDEVRNSLYMTKPAISQIYSSLEKKGYMTREIDMNDRRKILVKLTPDGHEILKKTKEYTEQVLNEIISRLGEDDTRQMIELFDRFADITEDLKTTKLRDEKKL